MSVAASIDLPPWAVVSSKRRAHIARVTTLLGRWAGEMAVGPSVVDAWRDAGRYHDALRDAPEADLRSISGDSEMPAAILHGPAAAARIAFEGETREEVLAAVRWHTVGCAEWQRTGRALYMADFLEPGREFDRELRAALAAEVPVNFDGTFTRVVRLRIEWTLREGKALHPETTRLWNAVR